MSLDIFFSIIAWVAVFLGVPGTIVQYRRVLKDGVEGISLATWLMFVYMGIYWITYGVIVRSLVVMMGSLVIFPIQLLVISHLSPLKHLKVLLGSGAFIFVCTWVPAMIWGWSAGIFGAGFAMVMNRLPQLVEVIRVQHVFGVSASSYAIGSFGSLLWIIHFLRERMWAAFFATVCAGTINILIMGFTILRHHQVATEEASNSNQDLLNN